MINLRGHLIRVHKVFWQLLRKLRDHFCITQEVVENTNFWKKRQNFQEKKDSGLFFSHYRVWQISGDIIQGFARFFDNCGSYKIISVTPNMLLKTQIFLKRKAIFPAKKKCGQDFLDYRLWQTSEDSLQRSKTYSDNSCGCHKIIFLGPKRLF